MLHSHTELVAIILDSTDWNITITAETPNYRWALCCPWCWEVTCTEEGDSQEQLQGGVQEEEMEGRSAGSVRANPPSTRPPIWV